MDKEHLVELITSSLFCGEKKIESDKSYLAMRTYLQRLNVEQLRTMSKEFIL